MPVNLVVIVAIDITRFEIVTIDAFNVHNGRLLGPEAFSTVIYTTKALFDDDLKALLVRLVQAHELLDELRGLVAAQGDSNCLSNRQLE